MSEFNTLSKQQWRIRSAKITADRGLDLDVTDSIMELVLYESIDKPYCTGQVAIAVNDAFVDENNFMGTERLTVKIDSQRSAGEVPDVESLGESNEGRTFVMTSMESVVKSNEEGTSSVYVFTLIDEHAVASKVKKVSRSIGGGVPLEIEMLKLIAELGKPCAIENSKSKQGVKWKGYVPYLHPLEAAEWLRDRVSTETEMPMFLYASMHRPELIISSLDVLMEKTPFNSDKRKHYFFSGADTQKQEYQEPPATGLRPVEEKQRSIKTFRAAKMQNQFHMALQKGATGATIATTNLNGEPQGGYIQPKHHSITRTIGLMENAGVTRGGQQNVYDPEFLVRGAGAGRAPGAGPMHDNDAAVIHQILSENTYTKDWKSIHFESEIEKQLSKMSTNAMMAMLYKNAYEVTIDGSLLLKEKKGVGDVVSIDIISDYLNIEERKTLDKLKSGDFLILNTRHTFRVPSHSVVLTVSKLSRED